MSTFNTDEYGVDTPWTAMVPVQVPIPNNLELMSLIAGFAQADVGLGGSSTAMV